MTQDTYDQAVTLQEGMAKYDAILAVQGNLFPDNLGEHFDQAIQLNEDKFNSLRNDFNTQFREMVTTERAALQSQFDELQDGEGEGER